MAKTSDYSGLFFKEALVSPESLRDEIFVAFLFFPFLFEQVCSFDS